MPAPGEPTKEEIMIVTGARALKDKELVLVGKGLPQLSATLAKMSHAPNMKMILEVGVVNSKPIDPTMGVADPRLWYEAEYMSGLVDILGMMLQRGIIDTGFLGGVQIDTYGNLNSTIVMDESGKQRRFIGSGGANDIASLAKRTVIIMKHERRRFLSPVHYVTSPGYLSGGDERKRLGLMGSGPEIVITDLCVFRFNRQTKKLELASTHPGVSFESVQEHTGFEVEKSKDLSGSPLPTERELELLRNVIDPKHQYVGK